MEQQRIVLVQGMGQAGYIFTGWTVDGDIVVLEQRPYATGVVTMVMSDQYSHQFQIVVAAGFEYDVTITGINDMAEVAVWISQQPNIIVIEGRQAGYVDHGRLVYSETGITGILSVCRLTSNSNGYRMFGHSSSKKTETFADQLPLAREWLATGRGSYLLASEERMLQAMLPRIFGHHAATLGICPDGKLLDYSQVVHGTMLTPLVEAPSESVIRFDVNEWPVQPRSMDLVLLHHALEFSEKPHRVLREACRTIVPGGKLVVVGFNPLSLWGIYRLFGMGANSIMRRARYFHHRRIEDWLTLLNFSRCHLHYGGHLYPFCSHLKPSHQSWLQSHAGLRKLPTGGFYMLVATKDRAGMTRYHSRWQASRKRLLGASYARNTASRDAT